MKEIRGIDQRSFRGTEEVLDIKIIYKGWRKLRSIIRTCKNDKKEIIIYINRKDNRGIIMSKILLEAMSDQIGRTMNIKIINGSWGDMIEVLDNRVGIMCIIISGGKWRGINKLINKIYRMNEICMIYTNNMKKMDWEDWKVTYPIMGGNDTEEDWNRIIRGIGLMINQID
jgi:hypothetical protein